MISIYYVTYCHVSFSPVFIESDDITFPVFKQHHKININLMINHLFTDISCGGYEGGLEVLIWEFENFVQNDSNGIVHAEAGYGHRG